jgi:hypothetical protein
MTNVKIINNPLKTLLFEGNIKNGSCLSAHLCPEYADIRSGSWNMAIKDLTYIAKQDINKFFNISTNLVDGKQVDKDKRIQPFQPPLQRFSVQSKGQKLVNFDIFWFTVNSPSDRVEINLQLWPETSNTLITTFDVDLYLTVLFNRIQ